MLISAPFLCGNLVAIRSQTHRYRCRAREDLLEWQPGCHGDAARRRATRLATWLPESAMPHAAAFRARHVSTTDSSTRSTNRSYVSIARL